MARSFEEAQRQEAEALGHAQRAAVPQVVKLAEGDVEKQPLPAIFVAEAGVEDWGNQHLAQLAAGVDPVLERGLDSEMFVESAVALLHLPLRARLAKELEARHVRSPGAGHVVLQPLWQRSPAAISPRQRHTDLADNRFGQKLRQLLGGELQQHFRLQRMIIRKDPASQGEISCLIVEELGGEAVAEFWKVAGAVLQQHGFAVGRQNVHVAVERLEDVNQVRAATGLKGVGWVLQPQKLNAASATLHLRRLLSPRPVVGVQLRALNQVAPLWLVIPGQLRLDLVLQAKARHPFQPHKDVDVDAPASVVELWVPPRVPGTLSVLELQASDPVFDRVASAPLPGLRSREDVLVLRVQPVVAARQKTCHGLREDVRDVQGLGRRRVLPLSAGLLQLVAQPLMIGPRPFVGADGHEERGPAKLFLKVHQRHVVGLPDLRTVGLGCQGLADLESAGVSCAADARPHPQVPHEVEQQRLLGVPDQAAVDLREEARFRALSTALRRQLRRLA